MASSYPTPPTPPASIEPHSPRVATRGTFVLVGLAGAVLASLFALLLALLTPSGGAWALLGAARWGSSIPALLFLAALGGIAVAEWPVMLFAFVRLARRALPAPLLYTLHFFYTGFPVVYGAMGAWLTGERWWFALMALIGWLRLSTSALVIHPTQMAERQAAGLAAPKGTGRTVTVAKAPVAHRADLGAVRGWVLDMDGVLYRGNQARAGAAAFARFLNAQGIPYVCLTNNASRTGAMFGEKLQTLGLPIGGEHVIGAAQAAAEWLAGELPPGARVLPVGEAGLRDELVRVGFTLVEAAPAEAVVVGIDFGLTYEKLKRAALAIRQRARFIGTNPDLTFPSEEGLLPGNGSTLTFLQAATGVAPTVVGKPQLAMMEVALAHLGRPAREVAMVGDRLDTDILGGQQAGMVTVLLRGGVTSDEELAASPIRPDFVFDDLAALLDAVYGQTA